MSLSDALSAPTNRAAYFWTTSMQNQQELSPALHLRGPCWLGHSFDDTEIMVKILPCRNLERASINRSKFAGIFFIPPYQV